MMLLLVEQEEMKKKQELKKDFSLIEMISDSGILKINVQNYGIYTMGKKPKVNLLEFSLFQIGLRWMFGSI